MKGPALSRPEIGHDRSKASCSSRCRKPRPRPDEEESTASDRLYVNTRQSLRWPRRRVRVQDGSWCSCGEPRTELFPLKTSFCPKMQRNEAERASRRRVTSSRWTPEPCALLLAFTMEDLAAAPAHSLGSASQAGKRKLPSDPEVPVLITAKPSTELWQHWVAQSDRF